MLSIFYWFDICGTNRELEQESIIIILFQKALQHVQFTLFDLIKYKIINKHW